MKKLSVGLAILLAGLCCVGCASTSNVAKTKVEAEDSKITDWSNKNLDAEAKPEWLKKLTTGNSDVFKKEFGVDSNYIIKYSVAGAKTRDAALAASRVNYNAMRAEELRTKVKSHAATNLNNEGMTDVIAEAAFLAKVDLSGQELVTQFWQKIETTKDDNVTSEYICYSVYKVSKEAWANTLKGFLAQIIPAIPDSDSQIKMAQSIQSLYDETANEKEVSKEVALAQIQAQQKNAEARIAEANAASASAVAKSQAQTAEKDLDWMSVLSAGVSLLLD